MPIRPGADCCRGGALTDHPHPFDLVRRITGDEFATVRVMNTAYESVSRGEAVGLEHISQ